MHYTKLAVPVSFLAQSLYYVISYRMISPAQLETGMLYRISYNTFFNRLTNTLNNNKIFPSTVQMESCDLAINRD